MQNDIYKTPPSQQLKCTTTSDKIFSKRRQTPGVIAVCLAHPSHQLYELPSPHVYIPVQPTIFLHELPSPHVYIHVPPTIFARSICNLPR